jgi:hypothetical protein
MVTYITRLDHAKLWIAIADALLAVKAASGRHLRALLAHKTTQQHTHVCMQA